MSNGLQRALNRPDSASMIKHIDVYAQGYSLDPSERSSEWYDAFEQIHHCYHDDPHKAFDYVLIAEWRSDDARFLASIGCGPLEDILCNPSPDLLQSVVEEAQISARFCWLLSHPFKHAIADVAWEAIKGFRSTGPGDEPPLDTLPPKSK